MFKVVKVDIDNKRHTYNTIPYIDSYKVPSKIYGTLNKKAKYIWNAFARANGRGSVLCTGRSGSGKSLFCKLLCNIASSTGTPVFIVSEIEIDTEFISYVSNLNNCLIFIDEFGKCMKRREMQELFLTLLSDNNKKRLFLLTENDRYMINKYILDRTERIRYHLEFNQLEPSVVEEFCKDQNVPNDFKESIQRLNITNSQFCFDHMHAIVTEAQYSGNWDLKWLIEILNVKSLSNGDSFKPIKVTSVNNPDVFLKLEPKKVTKGIVYILIKDPDINTKNSTRESTPLGLLNSKPKPPVQNVDTDNEEIKQIINSKKKLLDELKEVYRDVKVEPDTYDADGEYVPFHVRESYRNNALVKVNLDESMIVDVNGDVYTYYDVTKKFMVYLDRGNEKY